MHFLAVFLLTLGLFNQSDSSSNLQAVQDEDLMNLIRNEKYVAVLFTTKNCELCDDYENELSGLKDDFTNNLDAVTVKVVNSQLTRLYSPNKEPVLVFFRHGVPLLYNGPVNDELILHTFTNNKEPVVKELTDETFEHLTQAATGATTGDWFVMFYTPDCVDCNRLGARWETVGAQLKTRMNVARINKNEGGRYTARRFGVTDVPAFILFRQGKLYRYKIQKYDIASFIAFAQDWYKNMKPERIPLPKTPFDEFVESSLIFLQENPLLWQLGGSVCAVALVILVVMQFFGSNKKGDKAVKEKQKRPAKKADKKEK